MFEPFFTTKETGQGHRPRAVDDLRHRQAEQGLHLGVQRAGPRHDVQGLPAARAQTATARAAAAGRGGESGARSRRRRRPVLLVEDEPGVRQLSKRILDGAGYRVLEAANGDEAERLFAEHAAAIDLVVTDVVMPGCGGPELLARLQRQRAGAPGAVHVGLHRAGRGDDGGYRPRPAVRSEAVYLRRASCGTSVRRWTDENPIPTSIRGQDAHRHPGIRRDHRRRACRADERRW